MNRWKNRRWGAATVEMAVVSPLLFLFLFAGLEFSRVNMLKNVTENAALEGARAGIIAGAEASDCHAAAQTQLDIVNAKEYEITVTPSVIDQNTEEVSVSIYLPFTPNAMPMSQFVLGRSLTRTITLKREIFEDFNSDSAE